jgi:hypothetical protein
MTRTRPPKPLEVEAARRDPRFTAAVTADPDPGWRDRARCADPFLDAEVFYPLPTDPAGPALAICGGCPVRANCLAAALNAGDCEGVWGATTPRERRAMLIAWNGTGQAARGVFDHCPAGHETTLENTAVDTLGRRKCRACSDTALQRAREAFIVSRNAKAAAPLDMCARGRHERTADTIGEDTRGRAFCRPCRIADAKKGAAAAEASRVAAERVAS